MNYIKSLAHKLGRVYCQKICRGEFESQLFRRINERPIEFRFVFEKLTQSNIRSILDVGTGTTALPHLMRNCGYLVTAIDNISDYWPDGMVNRHYHVINDDITRTKISNKYDFISCISVLEHIKNHNDAIRNIFKLIEPGGSIILSFPYNETSYIENVYLHHDASYGKANSYICQVFSRKEIDRWLHENQGYIVTQEYWQVFTGEFWTCGDKLTLPIQVDILERHQLTCLHLKKAT